MSELRNAFRALRHAPLMISVVVLTLGLGIGATTAIFSIVNGVFIKPLPYPGRMRFSESFTPSAVSISRICQMPSIWHTWTTRRLFRDLWCVDARRNGNDHWRRSTEEVRALSVSRGLGTTLGMRPAIGRWFSTADDTPGAPDTVIITSAYWNRRFAGAPPCSNEHSLSTAAQLQIHRCDAAGLPVRQRISILLPLRIESRGTDPRIPTARHRQLKPGATVAHANADVARMFPIWLKSPIVRARWAPALRPLKQDVVGDVGRTLWVLLGAIGIILLMACANVANLLLVRGDAHRPELAVRSALGASWTRIARQLLVESLTLALCGGALGVALAYCGLQGPADDGTQTCLVCLRI